MSDRVRWNCHTPASRAMTATKLSMKPMMTMAARIDIAAATGLLSTSGSSLRPRYRPHRAAAMAAGRLSPAPAWPSVRHGTRGTTGTA